jgi:hypothetical protein
MNFFGLHWVRTRIECPYYIKNLERESVESFFFK